MASDKPQNASHGLSPAEEFVVAQATAGKIADLDGALNADQTKKFPKENDRRLSAHFLEDLLTVALPGIKLHRHGVRITGAIIDEPIHLENEQIPCEVQLDHCQFNNSVTFAGANFAGGLLFSGSRFKGEANFNGMKVGGDASLERAVVEGPVYFLAADIEGNLEAQWAMLHNKKNGAHFSGMKVRGDRAFFSGAEFEGPVGFGGADIANNLVVQSAKFQDNEVGAIFLGVKVRGDAMFDFTEFKGLVDFVGADIANNFQAGAKFENKKKWASFNRMKVGGPAFFNGSFEGPVDLRNAEFGWLDLSGASWPKGAGQLQMQGMSYKYILAAPKEPKSHEELLKVVSQAAYSGDVYSKLEAFFLRQGYRGDADEAFIAGKRRERDEYLRTGQRFQWLGSWMLDLLVCYGRRPWQAGIPCAALIALGCVLFSPKKMEPQKPDDAPRVYSRFWYSLGLFLPFVDLQADKVWKPKADQTFLRNYMRVHILLGWILVPLVLAALTGLIK